MRIVHLTDIHLRRTLLGTPSITKRLARRMGALLARAAQRIACERADLLVVSGDLVDFPSYGACDAELLAAAEEDLTLVRGILDGIGIPYAVVHGNHDPREVARRVFADAPREQALGGHRVICFHDEEVEGHAPQRLAQEREIYLKVIAETGAPQVHVQHYLVWPIRNEGYPHAYREAQSLRDQMVASRTVRLVLSGHYHPGIEPIREGDTYFATAPAFCEPPHAYWVYELSGDTLRKEERRLFDANAPRQKVVFLDRDGTISRDRCFRSRREDLAVLASSGEGLRRLQEAGFALVVVSSQSAVGEGYVTVEMVSEVNDGMASVLAKEGVELDGVYCSYHSPKGVIPEWSGDHPDCKPKPGLFLRAAQELHLDLGRAYMVGDIDSDLQAGRAAGARTVLVRTGHGAIVEREMKEGIVDRGLADAIVDDLRGAAEWILSQAGGAQIPRGT
ncbi:MAG: HAD-IIIA family hydrolase [Planctomycetota bacterium]